MKHMYVHTRNNHVHTGGVEGAPDGRRYDSGSAKEKKGRQGEAWLARQSQNYGSSA